MPWPLTQPAATLATDVTAQTVRHADDHNKIAALLAVLTPGPWVYVNPAGGAAPAFNTGWLNYGQGWQFARFRREMGDICRIEGLVYGGNGSTSVFTLPVGFRPAQYVRTLVGTAMTTGGAVPSNLDIAATGTVVPSNYSGSGTVAAVSLACTFVIDPAQL